MPLVESVSSDRHKGLQHLHGSSKSKYGLGFALTDDLAHSMQSFVEHDSDRDKTMSRIFVERYLAKRKWYFPMRDKHNGPDLSKAYAFYEHVTLPRHFTQGVDTTQRKAERGDFEAETRLYNPFTTKASALSEWGIAIASYFTSVKAIAFIMLGAFALNIINLKYFASSNYAVDKSTYFSRSFVQGCLRGSAICTQFEWVACPNCITSDFEKYGITEYGITEDDHILVRRNACGDDLWKPGIVNYATFFFLAFSMLLLNVYLNARETRSDEDKLTASDYSIVVRNPPPDAYNPDVWRDFFEKFAESQVTCVTVAIDNDEMLNKLIARRIHRNNLRLNLPPGTDMDDEDLVLNLIAQIEREKDAEAKGVLSCIIHLFVCPILHILRMFLPLQNLFDRVVKLTEEIKELQKKQYVVKNVFVTFETEESQRAALAALSVGSIHVVSNNVAAVVPANVFQGRVLWVERPPEPNAVRWLDLSSKFWFRVAMWLVNIAITLAIVAGAGFVVAHARNSIGSWFSGPLVSIFNFLIPLIVKILMIFEPHLSQSSFQTSLYLKITLFRWINTAILIKVITPFTRTITDDPSDELPAIMAIFVSELFLTPCLRLLDIWSNFHKHILAPRARTQEQMNSHFRGTYYNLGERYTDLTKVLFLCFFYAALLPAAFLFGFAILIVQHYVDKYCLLRIWGTTPTIGKELARFSRRYFFSMALIAFAVASAYAWAQFPYDNICDPDQPMNRDYSGVYENVALNNGTTVSITVNQSDEVMFCDQSWNSPAGQFPPTKDIQGTNKTWMSSSQEKLSTTYGWTSLWVTIFFIIALFGSIILKLAKGIFWPSGPPKGEMQRIDFSANPEISAYVPEIFLPSFPFPFLACDTEGIDEDLIGWTDPLRSYDFHNLMFDVPYEGMKRQARSETKISGDRSLKKPSKDNAEDVASQKPIFSVIKHYPPAWRQNAAEMADRGNQIGHV